MQRVAIVAADVCQHPIDDCDARDDEWAGEAPVDLELGVDDCAVSFDEVVDVLLCADDNIDGDMSAFSCQRP